MRLQDPDYLRKQQYADPANLAARIRLHDLYSTNPLGLHRWIFAKTSEQLSRDRAVILEVGGGHGELWRKNARQIPGGWQLVFSDLSEGMVQAARVALRDAFPAGVRFITAEAGQLPLTSASLDAVMGHFMLYHVPDLERALDEIWRVLKPGGWFFAATIGDDHLAEIYDMIRAFEPERDPRELDVSFSLENGARHLARCFTEVERLDYEDHLEITAPGPLVDYVLSMASTYRFDEGRIRQFADRVERMIAENGVLRVEKASGMFICRKVVSA